VFQLRLLNTHRGKNQFSFSPDGGGKNNEHGGAMETTTRPPTADDGTWTGHRGRRTQRRPWPTFCTDRQRNPNFQRKDRRGVRERVSKRADAQSGARPKVLIQPIFKTPTTSSQPDRVKSGASPRNELCLLLAKPSLERTACLDRPNIQTDYVQHLSVQDERGKIVNITRNKRRGNNRGVVDRMDRWTGCRQ
jgi:hypothetical protein